MSVEKNNNETKDNKGMATPDSHWNIMGHIPLWFGISLLLMLPGIVAMIISTVQIGTPLRMGLDFTGGSLVQLRFPKPVTLEQMKEVMHSQKLEGQVQTSQGNVLMIRTKPLDPKTTDKFMSATQAKLGNFTKERLETVGPTVGAELVRNALYAVLIAFIGIIGYVAFRYQFDFALCAIAATAHDLIIMLGIFAILGLSPLHVEIDSLFITALLTVAGFSTHDTIVIFDRFRENLRYAKKGDTFSQIANISVNQTFHRSINTSVTVILSLLPLVLFGGGSIFYFTLAMLIGVISGTYSSIFNASPLLVVWRDWGKKKQETAKA
ncbi:MAG TPA: protein translocase subunit SecF [Cyanobacteria bacterium UBA8530]|nr:protein translocase subunit SecF [Cyanobacteria bacterium UBA8530]